MAFTTGTDDYDTGVLGWGGYLIHPSEAAYAISAQAVQLTTDLSFPTGKSVRLLQHRSGGSGEKEEEREGRRGRELGCLSSFNPLVSLLHRSSRCYNKGWVARYSFFPLGG